MKPEPTFLAEIEKFTLKFRWNLKGPKIVKTILKKNKVGELPLLNFRIDYEATVIKQYGTGTRIDIPVRVKSKPLHLWAIDFQQGC